MQQNQISWRPLATTDFALLGNWLSRPHIRRWWNHDPSPEAVARDFGPTAVGEEPAEDLLTFLDQKAIGLVQRCRLADYPDYLTEIRSVIEVADEAFTLDYLLAEADQTGRGLGTAMVVAVLDDCWRCYPLAPEVIIPVAAGNVASWRMLEKVGLRRIGEGELTPDNPVDPPLHYLYRADRPDSARN